ncbi:MAG TPA: hypothetical protein VEM15_05200 [Thermodesulfobacteriota bacterium]|nr:hypothetical protein [Thermodesulfobacteriota bacterium]
MLRSRATIDGGGSTGDAGRSGPKAQGKLGAVLPYCITVDAVKIALVGQVKVADQGYLLSGGLFHQETE